MSAAKTKQPDFCGLSLDQVHEVLEQISVSADTLSSFAAYAAERADGSSGGQYDVHAVQHMAERIRAIADLAYQREWVGAALCGPRLAPGAKA